MASKNRLANDMYDEDFEDLSPGEKAQVTKAYNAQGGSAPTPRRARVPAGSISAEVGRIGVNGTKRAILEEGSTVEDLLVQTGFVLDRKKEGVQTQSDGQTVKFTDVVENGEIYVIAPGIDSNE